MSVAETASDTRHASVTERLDYIDGLRGLAMLMVLVFHCWAFGGQWRIDIPVGQHSVPLGGLIKFGSVGVSLFLVLSGFCLYWPFVKSPGRREPSLLEFARKRCRRILPPYYVALTFFAIATYFERGGSGLLASAGMHFAMLHNVRPEYFYDINGSFWSLALEFHLYILFPILVESFRRFPARAVLVSVLLLSTAFRFAAIFWGDAPDSPLVGVLTYSVFGRCLEFTLGMYVARLLAAQADRTRLRLPAPDVVLFGGILVAAGIGYRFGLAEVFKAAITGVLFMLLLMGASRSGSALHRALSARWIVTLGIFSYSVYLIHHPLATISGQWAAARGFTNTGNLLFQLLLVIPSMLLLGYVFYLLFERPFLTGPERRKVKTGESPLPPATVPAPVEGNAS